MTTDSPLGPPLIAPHFLKLNCVLDGDPNLNHVFTLRIVAYESVDTNQGTYQEPCKSVLPECALLLLETLESRPPDQQSLQETIQNYELQEDQMLIPLNKLSSVFPKDPEAELFTSCKAAIDEW